MFNDFFEDNWDDDFDDDDYDYYLDDDFFDCPCGCGGFFLDEEDSLVQDSYDDYVYDCLDDDDYIYDDIDEDDDYWDADGEANYGVYILTL